MTPPIHIQTHLTGLLALTAGMLVPWTVQADVSVVIEEFSDKVVISYTGTLNTMSFSPSVDNPTSELVPNSGSIIAGDGAADSVNIVAGGGIVTNDPGGFGSGGSDSTGVLSGDRFAIATNVLGYPAGYVSGDPISGSLTYNGESVASLGIYPILGPYQWNLSNGEKVRLRTLSLQAKANAVLKAQLIKKLKKLKKALKRAKKNGQKAKVKKLLKQIKKIKKQINTL